MHAPAHSSFLASAPPPPPPLLPPLLPPRCGGASPSTISPPARVWMTMRRSGSNPAVWRSSEAEVRAMSPGEMRSTVFTTAGRWQWEWVSRGQRGRQRAAQAGLAMLRRASGARHLRCALPCLWPCRPAHPR